MDGGAGGERIRRSGEANERARQEPGGLIQLDAAGNALALGCRLVVAHPLGDHDFGALRAAYHADLRAAFEAAPDLDTLLPDIIRATAA